MTYDELWRRLAAVYDAGEAKAIVRMVLDERFGLSATDVYCGKVTQLSSDKQTELEKIMQRLEQAEPVQYVLGTTMFCDKAIHVAPGVLIPRPETEELCRWVMETTVGDNPLILDVGTGSGCIAITLALELSGAKVTAWDVSTVAINIAGQNAFRLCADVNFMLQDALTPPSDEAKWNVIVSNPPYICEREKKDMERRLGKKHLPGGIWSVPCLAVIDAQGNLRGIVQKAEEMKDLKAASAALTRILNDYRAQEELIQKAAKAKDDRKTDLLLQAADININMPPQAQKNNAQTAMGKRTSFDPLSLVEELQTMAPDVAYAHIRALMAQGGHSRAQRQEMLAAFGGHLRRNNASPDRLRAVYTEMRNIDPGSMYAAYAEGAIALWVERKPLDKSTAVTEVDYSKGDSEVSSADYSDEDE